MKKTYNNLEKEEQKDYLKILYKISEKTTYNAFHYNLINFLNNIKITDNVEKIDKRIKEIENL